MFSIIFRPLSRVHFAYKENSLKCFSKLVITALIVYSMTNVYFIYMYIGSVNFQYGQSYGFINIAMSGWGM